MAKVNRGKQFEQQVKKNLLNIHDITVYRLQDSMGGYAGVANICDFIVYKYPTQYFIECKCHYGNTLPLSCITDNQLYGMFDMSKIRGVKAGVVMWYIDHDITVFFPVQEIVRLKRQGAKSINIKMLTDKSDIKFTIIPSKKKRTFFDYNFNVLF